MTYMLDAKVADTSAFHLSILNGILDGPPGFQSLGPSTIRAMQEKQVNVAQATRFYRLFDGFSRRVIGRVGCQLRGEVDVFSSQRCSVARTGDIC